MGGADSGAAQAAPRPHHLRALDKANWLRTERAKIKRRLRDGDLDFMVVLLTGNDAEWEAIVRDMRIDALLLAVKGVGPVTVYEVLDEAGVTSGRLRWRDLTFAKRERLATQLRTVLEGGDPIDTESDG